MPAYKKENDEFYEIKAIFVGKRIETEDTERFQVAFQRFRKEQYITTNWVNLFFTYRCQFEKYATVLFNISKWLRAA